MPDENTERILSSVASYYTQKLADFGPVPKGVDWRDEESQTVRFEQLAKLIDPAMPFSINDIGCGYGALFEFLASRCPDFTYVGCDISKEMVQAARGKHSGHTNARFDHSPEPAQTADYAVASGIFNVRMDWSDDDWLAYIESTIETLHRTSERGFAFNCLTSYSDADKMQPYLFYADPCHFFDLCKRKYSRNVALLHDYDLYEFTILVRK